MPETYLVEEVIERKIYLIRGHKVLLDSDLAALYGVSTWRLKEQVNRNRERFPLDFMFPLTRQEVRALTSQIARSKNGRGGRRHLPYVFTEQGVAMLSTVLNSERAIQVNITIMRTFVKLKQTLSTHKDLALKLNQLEGKIEKHDDEIQAIFDAIRDLMVPPEEKPKRRIGFHSVEN